MNIGITRVVHHRITCCLFIALISVGQTETTRRQFDLSPDLPTSPSKGDSKPSGGGMSRPGGGGGGGLPLGFSAIPNGIPPQNTPPGPVPVGMVAPGMVAPGMVPPAIPMAPFGLNHIILIMVPQFKTKFQQLPSWFHSSAKVSMPITVFFDKMNMGPPPLGMPPFVASASMSMANPLGRIPGTTNTTRPNNTTAATTARPSAAAAASSLHYHEVEPPPIFKGYYPYSRPYPYQEMLDGDPEVDAYAEHYQDQDHYDGYEPYGGYMQYDTEDRSMRRKRAIHESNMHSLFTKHIDSYKRRKRRDVLFNKTIHATERAVLLPKLENFLESAGMGGKSCLLRAICEIHEAPLHHYGLLGQLLTMFFSVSRSVFAESHLSEHLRAEQIGKSGKCTEYFQKCNKSMFSWEEHANMVQLNEI